MENFFMETPSNEIIFILGSGFFYVFTMGSISRRFCFFSRIIFFIFLCCYGMEWLLWRRLSLFFSVRRSWKINEVFKVFQIPLDLNLEAGTQTRKSNLLQIVFFYKLSSSPFLLFLNNFQLNFAPLFTFMPSHNVYMDKKKPWHSRNNFRRLALLSFPNKKTKYFLQRKMRKCSLGQVFLF